VALGVLLCVAVCCSVLLCVAVFFSALQCVVLVLDIWMYVDVCIYTEGAMGKFIGNESNNELRLPLYCRVLQSLAEYCRILQYVAPPHESRDIDRKLDKPLI